MVQPATTSRPVAQLTPLARSAPTPAGASAQPSTAAPGGAVVFVDPSPEESVPEEPQPLARIASRATASMPVAIESAGRRVPLIARHPIYGVALPCRIVLLAPRGRLPQIGQSGSGTTGSRSTSIVRRS
jgi:hypothetical protein